MAKRKKGINAGRKDFVSVIRRRKEKEADSKTLATLQNRVSRKTQAINWERQIREQDMMNFFDTSIGSMKERIDRKRERIQELLDSGNYTNAQLVQLSESLDKDTAKYNNLIMSQDQYMRSHMDKDVSLQNLAGKVRTTREAKEILRRLENFELESSDRRMKENYIKSLRRQGHANLADRIEAMNDEDFVKAYYANPNLQMGFSYSLNDIEFNYEGRDVFEVQWEETVEGLDIDLPYEREQLPFGGDIYEEDYELSPFDWS